MIYLKSKVKHHCSLFSPSLPLLALSSPSPLLSSPLLTLSSPSSHPPLTQYTCTCGKLSKEPNNTKTNRFVWTTKLSTGI